MCETSQPHVRTTRVVIRYGGGVEILNGKKEEMGEDKNKERVGWRKARGGCSSVKEGKTGPAHQ